MDWTALGLAAAGAGSLGKAAFVAVTGYSEKSTTWHKGADGHTHKHVETKEPWAGPGLTALFYTVAGVLLLLAATHTRLGHSLRAANDAKDRLTDKLTGVEFVVLGPVVLLLLLVMAAFGLGLVADGIREREPATFAAAVGFVLMAGYMGAYLGVTWVDAAFG
jgi:hypothetical protein